MKKVIKFVILTVAFLFILSIIWKKINHKSTDEIFQEKSEQFYENQDSFEKVVAYVNGFDFHSITENNEIWTDVIINGVMFKLTEWRSGYELSIHPAKTLLSQLLDSDEKISVVNVIGESSDMDILCDEKSYKIIAVYFSIEDKELEDARGSLLWHTSDYEPRGDWKYPLNENWTIVVMGVGY